MSTDGDHEVRLVVLFYVQTTPPTRPVQPAGRRRSGKYASLASIVHRAGVTRGSLLRLSAAPGSVVRTLNDVALNWRETKSSTTDSAPAVGFTALDNHE